MFTQTHKHTLSLCLSISSELVLQSGPELLRALQSPPGAEQVPVQVLGGAGWVGGAGGSDVYG